MLRQQSQRNQAAPKATNAQNMQKSSVDAIVIYLKVKVHG